MIGRALIEKASREIARVAARATLDAIAELDATATEADAEAEPPSPLAALLATLPPGTRITIEVPR